MIKETQTESVIQRPDLQWFHIDWYPIDEPSPLPAVQEREGILFCPICGSAIGVKNEETP